MAIMSPAYNQSNGELHIQQEVKEITPITAPPPETASSI